MPLLTPALTDAQSLLRAAHAHIATDPCPSLIRPQNRLQSLALHNAQATARDIAELDHHARILASHAEGDLATIHHLLAAHTCCATCTTLRRAADRIHHDLGREI